MFQIINRVVKSKHMYYALYFKYKCDNISKIFYSMLCNFYFFEINNLSY